MTSYLGRASWVQRDPRLSNIHRRLRIGCGGGAEGLQEARFEMLERLEASAELRVHSWPGDRCGLAELVTALGQPSPN
jgi:hypothetical protein